MGIAIGTRLGVYEVVGELGTGGMGEVYKARDTRLDRTVAIKVSTTLRNRSLSTFGQKPRAQSQSRFRQKLAARS